MFHVLRWLLSLYPTHVESEDRDEMVATIAARRRALGRASRIRTTRFWTREYWGIVRNAYVARREVPVPRSQRAPSGRWALVAGDIRVAVRTLRRRPALLAASVLVLSFGIGANGAMAGVGWAVLFGPMPIAEPDRAVRLFHDNDLTFGVSLNELLHYREASVTLADLAGWRIFDATYQSADGPVRVVRGQVTPNLFAVLGVRPDVGRSFQAAGSADEVVLSHRFWHASFGGDSAIVGRVVEFDGRAHVVAGVLSRDATFPDAAVDYYTSIDLTAPRPPGRGGLFLDVVARLAPAVTFETAATEVDHVATALRRADPAAYEAEPGFGAHLVPLRASLIASYEPLLAAMIAGAGLVLLTTCLNVSTLLLSHVESRSSDVALRRALGATTGDLVRVYAAEGLVIATAGAVGGILVARWVSGAFTTLVPVDLVASAGGAHQVVYAVLAASAAVGAFFAVLPVPMAARAARLESTRHTVPAPGRAGGAVRLLQTSIAVVLVSGMLLLAKTARNLATVDLGYRTDDVVTARITLPPGHTTSNAELTAFFERLTTRLRGQGGVRAAGIVSALPLSGLGGSGDVNIESIRPDSAVDVVAHRLASPPYFDALAIPLRAGRHLAATDRAGRPRVVVVDEAFARRFFSDPDAAVGQRIRSFFGGEDWNEIVGVIGAVRHGGPRRSSVPHVYYPFGQRPTRGVHLVLHVEGNPEATIMRIRRATAELDPSLPVYDIATMETRLRATTARSRFTLALFGGFAALALIVALIGVYGAVRLVQERRTREMGIRRALGASRRDVVWVTSRGALATTLVGAILGLAGAWSLGTLLEGLVFGVSARDPFILGGAAVATLAAGWIAAVVPAARTLHGELRAILAPP